MKKHLIAWGILSTMFMANTFAQKDIDRPIMGWSSWNTYHVNISEELIKQQADALIKHGLKEAGYNYINIDDGFFGHRDETGKMHPHPDRFPNGMKVVSDYIHSLGLKAGIYFSADDKKKLKPQKEGFFKKIKKVFFDSLEDDTETVESVSEAAESTSEAVGEKERIEENVVKESSDKGNSSSGDEPKDENEQIIEDVFGNKSTLDESQVPKKGFFARLKYRLEQMKAKHIEEEKAEEEAERLEEEEKQKNKELKKAAAAEKKEQKKQAGEAKKAQKANKPKKVKPKRVKKPKEPPKPQDILKIKPVSIVMLVLFVAGVSVLISVLSSGFYYNNSVSQAKDYYSNEQYEKAYDKLSGIKLNGSDKTLYEQASTIMYVQKQYDSYENYMKLNMKTEALDSLIKGVNRYNSLRPQAQELGIDNKFTAVYKQIVLALQDTFKISETEAIGLSSMSDTDFTNYYYRIEEYGKAVQ